MKETGPQLTQELKTAELVVSELNNNGFVSLEGNDSFLGRIGDFFTDKVKPAAKRVAIPASAALLLVTAAACSQGEASVDSVKSLDLPDPTRISEVSQPEAARRTSPPARITKDSIAKLPKELQIPEGTQVIIGSCTSDGKCLSDSDFYWPPTKEIVVQPRAREHKLSHEVCHAHQHWSTNGGHPLQDNDINLESWYETAEGKSFTEAVEGLPWPWKDSLENGIEDFAWTCGFFYFDPHYLQKQSPQRYEWALKNLPKPESVR